MLKVALHIKIEKIYKNHRNVNYKINYTSTDKWYPILVAQYAKKIQPSFKSLKNVLGNISFTFIIQKSICIIFDKLSIKIP